MKCGTAFKWLIALAVPTKLNGGKITSSSFLTPTTKRANLNPTVPLVTAIQKSAPVKSQSFFSKILTQFPAELTQPVSIQSFKYSKALVAHGKVWSFAEMNSYLIKPQAHIKGTKMAFAGLKSEKDRASVILYMNSFSDNPLSSP